MPAGRKGLGTATVESLAYTYPRCRARDVLRDILPAQTEAALGLCVDRCACLSVAAGDASRERTSVPRWDVVAFKGVYDGLELDAELDVAVADVFGGRFDTAPTMEGGFKCFHVPDETVHDRRDVGVELEVVSKGRQLDRGTYARRE